MTTSTHTAPESTLSVAAPPASDDTRPGTFRAAAHDQRNPEFPPKPRKRPKDNVEYAGMMRRLLRAYGKRVAMEDPDDLTELVALPDDLETVITQPGKSLPPHAYSS